MWCAIRFDDIDNELLNVAQWSELDGVASITLAYDSHPTPAAVSVYDWWNIFNLPSIAANYWPSLMGRFVAVYVATLERLPGDGTSLDKSWAWDVASH